MSMQQLICQYIFQVDKIFYTAPDHNTSPKKKKKIFDVSKLVSVPGPLRGWAVLGHVTLCMNEATDTPCARETVSLARACSIGRSLRTDYGQTPEIE